MAQTSARGGTLTARPDGAKLKSLRGDRKQKQVEDDNDIPRGQLTRFETNKPVGIKYLLRLARYYSRPAKELLHQDGVASTSDLLRDLAELHGAKLDFGTNGEHSEESADQDSGIREFIQA